MPPLLLREKRGLEKLLKANFHPVLVQSFSGTTRFAYLDVAVPIPDPPGLPRGNLFLPFVLIHYNWV